MSDHTAGRTIHGSFVDHRGRLIELTRDQGFWWTEIQGRPREQIRVATAVKMLRDASPETRQWFVGQPGGRLFDVWMKKVWHDNERSRPGHSAISTRIKSD